jgi:hypothetical protein
MRHSRINVGVGEKHIASFGVLWIVFHLIADELRLRAQGVVAGGDVSLLVCNTPLTKKLQSLWGSGSLPAEHADISRLVGRINMLSEEVLAAEAVLSVDLGSQSLGLSIRKPGLPKRSVDIRSNVATTQVLVCGWLCGDRTSVAKPSIATKACSIHP